MQGVFEIFLKAGVGVSPGTCRPLIGDERGGAGSTGSEGSEGSEGGVRRIKIRRHREYVWGDARRSLDRRLPSYRSLPLAGNAIKLRNR